VETTGNRLQFKCESEYEYEYNYWRLLQLKLSWHSGYRMGFFLNRIIHHDFNHIATAKLEFINATIGNYDLKELDIFNLWHGLKGIAFWAIKTVWDRIKCGFNGSTDMCAY